MCTIDPSAATGHALTLFSSTTANANECAAEGVNRAVMQVAGKAKCPEEGIEAAATELGFPLSGQPLVKAMTEMDNDGRGQARAPGTCAHARAGLGPRFKGWAPPPLLPMNICRGRHSV